MPKLTIAIALLAIITITSCTKKADTCTTSSTFDATCAQNTNSVDKVLLSINLNDATFYDQNTKSWVSVTKNDFDNNILPMDINLYSDKVYAQTPDAMKLIRLVESSGKDLALQKNEVFYIKADAKDGVEYSCSYKKIKNNVIVASMACSFERYGGYIYLPLINAKLDNKLYAPTDQVGDTFSNEVSIIAQTGTTRSEERIVKFNTIISVASTTYMVEGSEGLLDFNLNNRWSKYRSVDKKTPNQNLDLFKLSDTNKPLSAANTDMRVLFKKPPTLSIKQTVFFEIPMDLSVFKASKTIFPYRGYAFNVTDILVDSNKDFKYRVTIGGQELTNSSLEWKKDFFPSGSNLDIRFIADLNANSDYSKTTSSQTPLHQPLMPSCYLEKGKTYDPIVAETTRNIELAKSNSYAICDVSQKNTVSLPSSQTSSASLKDSWYNYFDYLPDGVNSLGSMYGIQQVTFRVEACLKIQYRVTGDEALDAWKTISSVNSTACGDIPESEKKEWVYVNYSKTFSIKDDLSSFNKNPALVNLINQLTGAVREKTPDPRMLFNGERLNGTSVRHLY